MKLRPIGWLVLLMALVEGGWLAFDGAHGLITGDYVTPSSGDYAGRLGPWSKLVEAVGIDPRSTLMMSIHLALGVGWLLVMFAYVKGVRVAKGGMILFAVLGLWYLPFGTLLSVLQIVLLLRPNDRARV